KLPKADLANQAIEIKKIGLKDSDLQLKMAKKDEPEIKVEENPETEEKEIAFEWPNWQVKVKDIDIANNQILYQNGEKPSELTEFNSDYLHLKDFTFQLKDFELSPDEKLLAQLREFSFEEESGIQLKKFNFDLS